VGYNPEDGGSMLLQNVGELLSDYEALIPEYTTIHSQRC
jgi:hypothetical protein